MMNESKQRLLNMTSNSNGAICKVCGDRASGKHYGVPSCDGCRGFFKRSIRRNLEYVCKEGGKCIVDVSRRNQCQACRFAKCLQSNMRREAVQHERAPRTCIGNQQDLIGIPLDLYSAHRRLPIHNSNGILLPLPMHANYTFSPSIINPTTRYSTMSSSLTPNRQFDPFCYSNSNSMFTPVIPSSATISQTQYLKMESIANTYHSPLIIPLSTSSSSTDITQTICTDTKPTMHTNKEDEVTSSEEANRTNDKPTYIQNSNFMMSIGAMINHDGFFESSTKLLYLAVKWAKSMPSFMQIPAKDQTILLENAWAELFILTAAQYGGLVIENLLSSPTDYKTRLLQKTINQAILQRIDHTEAACLKALILFRPDCAGLISTQQVAILQEQTLNLLLEKSGGIRMGQLLLTLPNIKTAADRKLLQEQLFRKTVNEEELERLVCDLIRN